MAKLRFSACHLIPGHSRCGRLHGHTYAVSVHLEGEKREEDGFILDFFELKEAVLEICGRLDHRVIIAGRDPKLEIQQKGESLEVKVLGEKTYLLPLDDVVMLPIPSASAEDLCSYFITELVDRLDLEERGNLWSLEVRLDEGVGQGAGCRFDFGGGSFEK